MDRTVTWCFRHLSLLNMTHWSLPLLYIPAIGPKRLCQCPVAQNAVVVQTTGYGAIGSDRSPGSCLSGSVGVTVLVWEEKLTYRRIVTMSATWPLICAPGGGGDGMVRSALRRQGVRRQRQFNGLVHLQVMRRRRLEVDCLRSWRCAALSSGSRRPSSPPSAWRPNLTFSTQNAEVDGQPNDEGEADQSTDNTTHNGPDVGSTPAGRIRGRRNALRELWVTLGCSPSHAPRWRTGRCRSSRGLQLVWPRVRTAFSTM
ncbi:hypothetical protein C8Q76DRAFT_102852 [Earliella scabrosa]|nr:hypothetical protein C8Q76DRAFT_102852 [Earliella scabrosa]